MSFASRLKQTMQDKGITQTDLAVHIGKGKSSVSQYISGKNIPRNDVQRQIAEYLNVSVEWLNEESDDHEHGFRNLPVYEAAKRLGVCPQSIRIALQNGTAPYGYAWKNKTKWSYHISEKKLNEYMGYEKSTTGTAIPNGANQIIQGHYNTERR